MMLQKMALNDAHDSESPEPETPSIIHLTLDKPMAKNGTRPQRNLGDDCRVKSKKRRAQQALDGEDSISSSDSWDGF